MHKSQEIKKKGYLIYKMCGNILLTNKIFKYKNKNKNKKGLCIKTF